MTILNFSQHALRTCIPHKWCVLVRNMGGRATDLIHLSSFLSRRRVLYFALRAWKPKAQAFIGPTFQRRYFAEEGEVVQKKWNAQCTSALVAMAARVSFISIWFPLHEGTGLAGFPTGSSLDWCVSRYRFFEESRKEENKPWQCIF